MGKAYQSFDPGFELFLGLSNGLLSAQDGDGFPVCVLLSWEDDSGTGLFADTLDVGSLDTNQKLVMFGLGSDFSSHASQLLLSRKGLEHSLGFLNIFLGTPDGDLQKNPKIEDKLNSNNITNF